jgi:hypothetical protein
MELKYNLDFLNPEQVIEILEGSLLLLQGLDIEKVELLMLEGRGVEIG